MPFFFVTGDEGFWEKIDSQTIERILGTGASKQNQFDAEQVWKQLMKKYNVFLLRKKYWEEYEEIP